MLEGNGSVSGSYELLNQECASIRRGEPVRSIAERIGASLRNQVSRFADPSVAKGKQQTLIVAGYDSDGRQVGFAIRFTISAAEAPDFTLWDLSNDCSALSGEIRAAVALREGTEPIPRLLSDRRDVEIVRKTYGQRSAPCSELSEDDAKEFYRLAVKVTRDYAKEFGIPLGVVGWPLDFITVRPATQPVQRESSPPDRPPFNSP